MTSRSSDFVTRLPVDRAFTMKGFGAVVTGTLVSGEIASALSLDALEPNPYIPRAFDRGRW